MPFTARAVMFAAMACMFVAACNDKPAPTPSAASTATAAKSGTPAAQLPPNMVAAVSSSRSSSSIELHFALQSAPTVGKPLAVDIAIVPHQPFDSVHAFFEAPEALAMSAGSHIAPRDDVKAETVLDHRLRVQPTEEGVFLITAAVETKSEEGTITRIYSIPVIVNAASAAPASSVAPAPAPTTGG